RLQESLGLDTGVPQRRISLVAGCRIHLRHLHDPLSHAEVNAHPGGRLRPPPTLSFPKIISARCGIYTDSYLRIRGICYGQSEMQIISSTTKLGSSSMPKARVLTVPTRFHHRNHGRPHQGADYVLALDIALSFRP